MTNVPLDPKPQSDRISWLRGREAIRSNVSKPGTRRKAGASGFTGYADRSIDLPRQAV
ncbi:MAG: hypothetical protein O7C75_02665 [Verrucomicrobia bacterium]|nr:hypothetical protein [Verrucomicrobiota bacterium]